MAEASDLKSLKCGFESHYLYVNFSEALSDIYLGALFSRQDWSGPEEFVVMQKGYPEGIAINKNTADATKIREGTICVFKPYLMKSEGYVKSNPYNVFAPYTPNQIDLFATDWYDVTEYHSD